MTEFFLVTGALILTGVATYRIGYASAQHKYELTQRELEAGTAGLWERLKILEQAVVLRDEDPDQAEAWKTLPQHGVDPSTGDQQKNIT